MTFSDWLSQTRENIATDGWDGVRESTYEFRLGVLRRLDWFVGQGTNVFDREWDVLVILDGCRTDAIAEVAPDYEFLDTPGVHRSPGSSSPQWMKRTFTDEYAEAMSKTAHVSANPFTDSYTGPAEWALLEEVWRNGWDSEKGIVPARRVTDRAIQIARDETVEFDRLLVHYMQPHFPSIPEPLGSGADLQEWRDGREMAWQGLRRGAFSEDQVWQSYIANLRYVLEDVEILLSNLDAERVVLSADHGNAKGEWGIYGHPNVPLEVLREVPWYVTSATDEHTRDPEFEIDQEPDDDTTVEERLGALGYTE